MIKMMMAAAALSIGLMMMPVATTPAKAGANITIDLGGSLGGRISCRRGALIVEDYGFRRVRPRDCSGRRYSYFGRRHGDDFVIRVDSRSGRIVGISRIW